MEAALAQAGGSLIAAIEALRSDGRSLVPFEVPELNSLEEEVQAENELLDPERASWRWRKLSLPKVLPWLDDPSSQWRRADQSPFSPEKTG